jgi:pimeloyl-ACP methyl ester carboxylesterase
MKSTLTYAAWRHIPSTYLICEADKALPPAAQEQIVARSAGAITAERCSAGHSPFLSQPDVVAKVIQKMAQE